MEQSVITEAFEKALTNPRVIKLVADLTAKEMISKKSSPSNDEAALAKNHVVFAQEDSETGVWETVKEISTRIQEFKEGTIRPRVFGKALMADAVKTKDSAVGRKYFIEGVFEEITSEVLEAISNPKATPVKSTTAKAEDLEVESEEVKEETPLTYEDLSGMDIEELLEVNEAVGFMKPKKAKKLDSDELREGLIKALGLVKSEKKSKKVKEKDVDKSDIDAAPTVEEVDEASKESKEKKSKKDKKKKKKNKK